MALKSEVEARKEEVLETIDKGITLHKAEDAFRWCRKIGIDVVAYFLYYIVKTEESVK